MKTLIEIYCFVITLFILLSLEDPIILTLYLLSTLIALVQKMGSCTHALALASTSPSPWKDPNVWSNLAFLMVGVIVLLTPPKTSKNSKNSKKNIPIACSLFLVFLGSTAFHIIENPFTLVLDRIGMCSVIAVLAVILFHIEKNSSAQPLEFIVWFGVSLLGVLSCNRGRGKVWIIYRVALLLYALYVAIHRKNVYIGIGLLLCFLGDSIAAIRGIEVWLLRFCGISGHAWKHLLMAIGVGLIAFA